MKRDVESLEREVFDVVVIGGGMHGAWITRRVAARGHRVALLERDDLCAATSSNSLNILHGGLRYLQNLDFPRMRASIRARRDFARLAPQLIRPLPCVMPLRSTGTRSPWILGPALLVNDAIGFDRNLRVGNATRLPRGRTVSARRTREMVAPLAPMRPTAGALWWDLLSQDTARLALEVLQQASAEGAVIANHVSAEKLLIDQGRVTGLVARDALTGRNVTVGARHVVDATGPWGGQLALDSGLPAAYRPKSWVGALNLVLRRPLGIDQAVALSSATRQADASTLLNRSRRELFFVPWRGVAAVGTDYVSVPSADAQRPPEGMVESFVAEIARAAPNAALELADVADVQWGVLPGSADDPAQPSKSPIIATGVPATGAAGLTVVIAEKLTSAPTLSQRVVQCVCADASRRPLDPTRGGADDGDADDRADPGVDENVRRRLTARYGQRWRHVASGCNGLPALLEPLAPGSQALGAEVVHAVRSEMAVTLPDVVRRLGLAGTGPVCRRVLERAATIAATEWGWSKEATDRAVSSFFACSRTGEEGS